jgi:hypothetical protein
MKYTYEVFKWQERTFIQEFENDEKIQGAYVALSNVMGVTNTYNLKSDLHFRVRTWLLKNHPELII